MRSRLLSLLCLVIFSSFSTNDSVIDRILNKTIPWELKATKNNLSIHSRSLRNVDNKETRQLLCTTPTTIGSEALLDALYDPTFSTKWLKRVKECRTIATESPAVWHTYICFDFPWPMSKRDIVIENRLVQIGNISLIEMKGVDEVLPHYEDITRMKGFYGYWRLTENTSLEYSIYSNVESKIPTWTTDPFMEKYLFESLAKFNTEVEKRIENSNS